MNYKQNCLIVASIIGLSISSSIPSQAATNSMSLSQNIAAVEVERAMLLARFIPQAPVIQKLSDRYTTLMTQLKQREPKRYQTLAASATQAALTEKIGALEVERAIALTRFQRHDPKVQILNEQRLLLVERLKQLQPKRYQALAASATQTAFRSKIVVLQTEYQQADRNWSLD